jgi:cell shape-determining protein MreC
MVPIAYQDAVIKLNRAIDVVKELIVIIFIQNNITIINRKKMERLVLENNRLLDEINQLYHRLQQYQFLKEESDHLFLLLGTQQDELQE